MNVLSHYSGHNFFECLNFVMFLSVNCKAVIHMHSNHSISFQMPYFHSFKAKSKHSIVFILWKFTLSVSQLPVNSKDSEKSESFILPLEPAE